MDAKLEKIENKIDKLDERLDSIDVTIIKQHSTLEEHMRRSLANERAVEILKDELKPVFTSHVILNFLGRLALLVLSSSAIWEIIKKLISL